MITSVVFITCLTIILWNLWNKVLRKRNLPPGPLNIPFIGALYLFHDKTRRPYEVLTELSEKYGKIFGLQMGSIYTVVLADPALIRDALKRDDYAGRAPLYLTHGIMGGKGIICAEGSLWRDQRKCAINWLRHLGMLKMHNDKRLQLERRIFVHVQNAVQTISKSCWTNEGRDVELDLLPVLSHNLGNVMNDILFGHSYLEDDKTWKYLLNLQIEAMEHIGVAGLVNFFPFLRFLPKNRKVMKFILEGKEKTHEIYTELIRVAEARLQANNYELQDSTNILELFLKERHTRARSTDDPEFGDSQLNHLVADIFGAGLDTTMTTIRWTLLYVARDKRIQERLDQEFNEVLAKGADVSMEYYDSLGYLRACIAEAQRLRSVVPMGVPHGTTTESELADFHIPRHTMVLPLQWAIHMHPDEWPEPDLYKPERFYDSHTTQFSPANPQHFMPFQTGKRMCLGDDLAKTLLFVFTGNLLRHFTMHVVDGATTVEELLKGVDGFTLAPPQHTIRISEKKKWK